MVLRGERHVIELVRPPDSGSFVVNGANFTAKSPACSPWTAGERITLLAGDWHGRCVDAVFHNVARHSACQVWCGEAPRERQASLAYCSPSLSGSAALAVGFVTVN
jgi:hypothetical protein